jgi:hypothetical protein
VPYAVQYIRSLYDLVFPHSELVDSGYGVHNGTHITDQDSSVQSKVSFHETLTAVMASLDT